MAQPCPPSAAADRTGESSSQPSGSPAAATVIREAGPRTLVEIVTLAHQRQADEIHLSAGERPRLREEGDLNRTDWPITGHEEIGRMVREILSEPQLKTFDEQNEYISGHDFGCVRARINLFQSRHERSIKVRLITPKAPTFSEDLLPPEIEPLLKRRGGLILVTGSKRSGKTTAVAAITDHINRRHSRHILTFEDPIAFVHQGDRCLIRQRDLHLHTKGFAHAVKASLREDADVIVIDEILNRDMLNAAIEASLHGQLVIASLQTNTFSRTIERVLSLYIPGEHPRIRRGMSQALLAEITVRGIGSEPSTGQRIRLNLEAHRDYRSLQPSSSQGVSKQETHPVRTTPSFARPTTPQPLL